MKHLRGKMGNSIRIFCFLVISWFAIAPAFPQEILVSAPPYHPETGLSLSRAGRLKAAVLDTIEIPFIDDFSRLTGLPDTAIWTDDMAFINNSYSNNPVSIGVATLDAINAEGKLNGDSDIPFPSDFLTSKPINLDYPGRDDIYLSFYYQSKGLGDAPEEGDSLMLEFYAPGQYKWKKVWSVPGGPVTPFEQVFIPVSDTAYLHAGFQFRFSNYASLPNSQSFPSFDANVDQWNIDYVVLDTARSPAQTSRQDVSMVGNLPSFLKNYQAIPWSHFSLAFFTELRESLDISYHNLDEVVRNITRKLEIRDMYSGQTYSQSGGAINIDPGESGQYPFPPDYPFDFYSADSVVFEIKSYLVTEAGDYRWNDTVKRNQFFTDFYAYDDGTAEFGYGLSGEGTENAAVACKFKSFQQDTLRGVRFYFNRSLDELPLYFSLAVWDHDDELNQPGELVYSMPGNRKAYYNELNKFRTYGFDTLLVVNNFFYVGWIKTRADILNVGFDINNNSRDNIYYNLGQSWDNTIYSGSLMMRPVMGKKISWPVSAEDPPVANFEVYPNPARDYIRIKCPEDFWEDRFLVEIWSLQGSLVYRHDLDHPEIDISAIRPGVYIMHVSTDQSVTFTRKLIISR
jgi:hypothetical protein